MAAICDIRHGLFGNHEPTDASCCHDLLVNLEQYDDMVRPVKRWLNTPIPKTTHWLGLLYSETGHKNFLKVERTDSEKEYLMVLMGADSTESSGMHTVAFAEAFIPFVAFLKHRLISLSKKIAAEYQKKVETRGTKNANETFIRCTGWAEAIPNVVEYIKKVDRSFAEKQPAPISNVGTTPSDAA
jgi:hypothetical protein